MKLTRLASALTCAALAAFASGCTFLQEHDTAASIVVQYAAAKVIEEGKTPEERLRKAQRIKAYIGDATTWFDGDSVELPQLRAKAFARLAEENLGAADLAAASGLLDVVLLAIEEKVQLGVISDTDKATVNQLLKWTTRAAELYGA